MNTYNKKLSLTFAAIYLKNGRKLYFSSFLDSDAISKEKGIAGLRERLILNRFLGQYNCAIIFDNNTKQILEKYNEKGIKTYCQTESTYPVNDK